MTDIGSTIRQMNPWWAGEIRADYTSREVLAELITAMDFRHIKDILGVRRSGKTTLLTMLIMHLIKKGIPPKKIFFLTFDDINLSTASFDDIEKTIIGIELSPEFLFIDEIQEKKGWERWVKRLYDSKALKQIFVSGSNSSLLSKEIGSLLTGRHITTVNFPFSFREFLEANKFETKESFILGNKNKVMHFLGIYLKQGGFPETLSKDDSASARILSNIYNDIISRDIATRYSMERSKIDLLAKYLFTNIGKEYSYNSLAEKVGINIETAQNYLNYLRESFLLFSMDVFSYKLGVQYKKNKKIYAVDTGLRNSACFSFSQDLGRIYENAVFLELLRQEKEVYYWKEDFEIDFVVKQGLNVTDLIQVTAETNISGKEISKTAGIAKKLKVKDVLFITEDRFEKKKYEGVTVSFVPLWRFLSISKN